MSNQLTVISGCPRNGTSVMSLCILHAVGKEALMGSDFPRQRRRLAAAPPTDVQAYYQDKISARGGVKPEAIKAAAAKEEAETKDMNPLGFWECRYSVKGIQYHDDFPELAGKYAKIVSHGVAASNPAFIGKIVFMLRDPRQVAKSQERLQRPHLPPDAIIHSPEMFIRVNAQFADWIIKHGKSAEVLVVEYDELIADATGQLQKVAGFLGLPPSAFAADLVKPSLKRSAAENLSHHLWPAADRIYQAIRRADWQAVCDIHAEALPAITRDNVATNCERLDERVYYNECVNCIHNDSTRRSFKARAIAKGIPWQDKPCMFLCHKAPDIPLVPLQQTIDNNHWRDDGDDFTPPTITAKAAIALGTLARVVGAAVTGRPVVARRDVIDARLATCEACPLMQADTCKACGCNVNKKIRVAQSRCPKGRWPQ